MSKKTGKNKLILEKEPEIGPPPCGCAIGDLLALQTDIVLPLSDALIGDLSEKKAEPDPPPCGCAIGDLLEKQVETNLSPFDDVPNGYIKKDQ
jgi:hypothetical protein